jgi:hypothetical protein
MPRIRRARFGDGVAIFCSRSCRAEKGAKSTGLCTSRPDPYVGFVTNMAEPGATGQGVTGSWAYGGHVGLAAADALCKAIGAEHVCSLAELEASDAVGSLAALPTDQTFWLARTSYVDDPTLAASPCSSNVDCPLGRDCNPTTHACAFPWGAAARCDAFTYAGVVHAVGEWFRRVEGGGSPGTGAISVGSLDLHVSGGAPVCQDASKLGCAGSCATKRAIPCCRKGCGS